MSCTVGILQPAFLTASSSVEVVVAKSYALSSSIIINLGAWLNTVTMVNNTPSNTPTAKPTYSFLLLMLTFSYSVLIYLHTNIPIYQYRYIIQSDSYPNHTT